MNYGNSHIHWKVLKIKAAETPDCMDTITASLCTSFRLLLYTLCLHRYARIVAYLKI